MNTLKKRSKKERKNKFQFTSEEKKTDKKQKKGSYLPRKLNGINIIRAWKKRGKKMELRRNK